MAIVTLAKRPFSGAGELARSVSENLGCRLVSREDIIKKTALYGMSGDRQDRARRRRLGMLNRMDLQWLHYIVFSRAALTKEIRQGSLVYLGGNGRGLLRDFPNVLNVNIVADMEYRIDTLIRRTEYVINRKKARALIDQIDEKERRWRKTLYQDGWNEPADFDLVIEPGLTTIPDACDVIRSTLD